MADEGDKHTTSFLKKLEKIVLDNLNNEQFGVEDLSEAYGLSRSQLHKKLKKQTGKSVSQFIREVRLEEAKKLLEQEDVTASEVGYQVGFSSATYFNTRFKDYFGYPPGEVKVRASYEKSSEESTFNGGANPQGARRKNRQKWLVGGVVLSLFVIVGFFFFKNLNTPRDAVETVNQNFYIADSTSAEKTIAVLPLKNWSGDPDLEYISDGMTDAIITKLAKIGDIDRVVPFTSMTSYKSTDKSIMEIASELKVKNILQGSFQLAGENVNVKLQMIDGNSEKQFWENEYKRIWKTDEIFELQSEVAENVAKKINVKISDIEQKSIEVIPTDNKEAYRLFLQAQFKFSTVSRNEIEQVIPLFEKAIKLDSTFIEPYMRLASANLLTGAVWGMVSQEEAWSRTKSILLKGLEMDKSNSKKYQEILKLELNNGIFLYEWNIDWVEREYNDSPYPTKAKFVSGFFVNYYDYARKTGKFEDAYIMSIEYLEKFPERTWSYLGMASILYFLGRNEEAVDILNEHDAVFDRDYFYLMESAKYYHYLGEHEKSKKHLHRFKELFVDRPPIIHWLDAIHSEMKGKTKRVKEIVSVLESLYEQNVSGSPAWFLALYYCHIKDFDQAFEWLQKSYGHHEVEMTWLKEEPVLRPLKNDPRYLELYKKVGFSIVDQSIEKQKIRP